MPRTLRRVIHPVLAISAWLGGACWRWRAVPLLVVATLPLPAASARVNVQTGISYAGAGHPRQALDLYLPMVRTAPGLLPVIVFIHGGGWVGGSASAGRTVLLPYVESGAYAAVSVGYRLAGDAAWPAQLHDVKAAIRWIRAHAVEHGLDPAKIGVIGPSAGGTLATLLGTTAGLSELDGEVGPHRGESTRVACVVNRFGRINFLAEPAAARAAPAQAVALAGRLRLLFGGTLEDKTDLARRASAVNHLTPDDPPILTVHGTADQLVPYVQAEELAAAARRAGVAHALLPMQGFGHGFQSPEEDRRVRAFFDRQLRGMQVEVSLTPIVAPGKK